MDLDTIREPTFIGCLPTDLFQVIQSYLSHKDYRNLMNSNKATFASIKYETVVYRINLTKYYVGKEPESDEVFYYNVINAKVKDKSKQIYVIITKASLSRILLYGVGLRGIRDLYLSDVDGLNDTFDFNMFNNIYKVRLWRFRGVERISSGFENVKELSISCFHDLQSITNINTTKTLEVFCVYVCKKLNILNFPLNNIIRLQLEHVTPNFNLQTFTRSTLKELWIKADQPNQWMLLNPIDFSSLQDLSLHCHFPDSFHNFSLFENIDELSLCSTSATSISISLTKFNGRRLSLTNFEVFGLIQNMTNYRASFVSLKKLSFNRCHDFTDIPSLPDLEELCLVQCSQVKSIPSLKNLQYLSMNECNELFLISPDQPKLNECSIISTKIEDVSFAAHCETAHLQLTCQPIDLSILGQVKSLHISHRLTSLDGLSGDPLALQPDQRYLSLSNLFNVYIFSLHHIFSLRLVGLPYLRSCEGIHHIEHLHIHKCDDLVTTSGLKHITRSLDISDCPLFDSLVDVEGIPLIRLKGNSRLKDYSAVQDEWTDCGVMDKRVQLFALKSMKEEMKEPAWRETIARLLKA